jgi:hypothetical protein
MAGFDRTWDRILRGDLKSVSGLRDFEPYTEAERRQITREKERDELEAWRMKQGERPSPTIMFDSASRYCPDTTAKKAAEALEVAEIAARAPDVYAWRSVEELMGR